MAVAQKKGSPAPQEVVQMVPVDKLAPTPDNRRGAFVESSVQSLAKSIAAGGVLQPLVVRVHPTEKNKWEIRAGERRWRAAQVAGLKVVPAIVRQLNDEEALAVTIAENLERQDLHPLEMAETIQLAFERGYDLKALASNVGLSLRQLSRRASLTRLAKVWRKQVLTPNSQAGRLSVAHLELLARLPEATQEALAADEGYAVFGRGFPTVDELRRIIDRGLFSLQAMPWDLEDETLEPQAGPCLNCEKRSGKQPLLFADEDAPKGGKVSPTDRCLDPACYTRKHTAHLQRCEAKLRQEHPRLELIQVETGHLSAAAGQAFGDKVRRVYHPARSSRCGFGGWPTPAPIAWAVRQPTPSGYARCWVGITPPWRPKPLRPFPNRPVGRRSMRMGPPKEPRRSPRRPQRPRLGGHEGAGT